MSLFIEKWMRGGISYIAKTFSDANNKYIKCYGNNKESNFIMYLNINTLHGWVMRQ